LLALKVEQSENRRQNFKGRAGSEMWSIDHGQCVAIEHQNSDTGEVDGVAERALTDK
jgi:hypothetical protein